MSFYNAACSEYNLTHQVVQVGSEKSDSFNPLIQLLGLLSVCVSVSLGVTEGKKRNGQREKKK